MRAAPGMALLLLGAGLALAQPASPLVGTRWELLELRSPDDPNGTVRVEDPARYTLAFGADGDVTLRLDCNRGRGAWRSEAPGMLAFGAIAMTRACARPRRWMCASGGNCLSSVPMRCRTIRSGWNCRPMASCRSGAGRTRNGLLTLRAAQRPCGAAHRAAHWRRTAACSPSAQARPPRPVSH